MSSTVLEHPSEAACVRIRVQGKRLAALQAMQGVVFALQDRPQAFLVALRANEVFWLSRIVPLAKPVYEATGWSAVKLVAIKLCLRSLRSADFVFERSKLDLQKGILELRILNCQRQFLNGGFDFRAASALRRLHKALENPNEFRSAPDRARYAVSPLGNAVQCLEVEIHRVLSARKRQLKALDEMRVCATASAPQKGGRGAA